MRHKDLFGLGKWVTPSEICDTPYVRGEFGVENTGDIKEASITICGLGFFKAYINGMKVSDDLFVPLVTDYHQYDNQEAFSFYGEVLSHRIICPQYDITDLLTEGKNIIGVMLGPGYYKYRHNPPYGEVKLCFRITISRESGETEYINSDPSLKWARSYITKSDFTIGEEHDYSLEIPGWLETDFDDSAWANTIETTIPDTDLYIQDSPADKIQRYIKPVVIGETDIVVVYDVGENITGYPVIYHNSKLKEKVIVRVSEERTPNGLLDEAYIHDQISTFITDGKERFMHIGFTWNAFRYVEVTKNAVMTDCVVIHADVKRTSAFECDNKVLNWLYDACCRTQLNNMHCGIPTDCPHIERRGYTGDGQLMCETVMMLFEGESFYRKWINDIADCQDTLSGHVQYTAPYVRSGGGPGGWGCAIVEVPYVFYKMYGDMDLLRDMYPRMLKYFDYLEAHSENDLVVRDQPDLWCLGDWCTAETIKIPTPYVNNFFYIKSMERVIEIERILGINDKTNELKRRIINKAKALSDNFFDPETGDFCSNIQGANAFAVYLNLGDNRTFDHLVSYYRDYGMYDSGIFGTDILTKVLFDGGYPDVAFKLMSSTGKYSFGNWMNRGSTTLWEYWTDDRSHDHPMFGAVTRYLFMYILGIRQKEDSCCYNDFTIEPADIKDLNYAEGHITTKNGRIFVKYVKADNYIDFTVEIEADGADFRFGEYSRRLNKGKNRFSILKESL